MSAVSLLQIFSSPGVTTQSGTPNLLRDLSNLCYQAQWNDMTQGGAATAQFDCRQPYESTVDILFGNYVVWGYLGATLSINAHVGDSVLSISGIFNEQMAGVRDLYTNDVVVISDGTNTEFFKITVNTNTQITLKAPGGNVLGLGAVLLNAYAAGSTICRLQFQGYVTQRVHSTAKDLQFAVNTNGFFNRYGSIIGNAMVFAQDGAAWLSNHCKLLAGQPHLGGTVGQIYAIGSTTFLCTDLVSLNVGQGIIISGNGIKGGNAESFTVSGINFTLFQITVSSPSTKQHKQGDTVYGTVQLPDLVIDDANFASVSVPVNLQATDQPFAQLIAAVLRQETGTSTSIAYACWADQLRQVFHKTISTVPYLIQETKLKAGPYPVGTVTFTPVSMTNIHTGRFINIYGAAGTDFLVVQSITANTFTTTTGSFWAHLAGDKVTAQYNVAATFNLTLSDQGSTWGDTINKIQTTDQDGSGLINAAIVSGTSISQDGTVEAKLSGNYSAGAQSFTVYGSMPFHDGDQVTLTPASPQNAETLTIDQDPIGSTFHTSQPCAHPHTDTQLVVLSSSAGPRIIVEMTESINAVGWFEGTLSSPDITDKASLAKWAGFQMAITAWPVTAASVDFDTASCRLTARDLVDITGFTDGIDLIQNVSTIQYQWLAAQRNATASMQLGQMNPGGTAFINERAKEHVVNQNKQNPRKRNRNSDGHMHGALMYQDPAGTSPNKFVVDAHTIKKDGVVYQVPQFNGTAPEGESWWGSDVSNPSSPTLAQLPSRVWNGRRVYAESVWTLTSDDGVAPVEVAAFQGIPLYKVEVRNGVLQGWRALFSTSGVGLGNAPSVALPVAPTVSSASAANASLANGIASDVTLTAAFNNIPSDDQTHSIKYYLQTHGSLNPPSHKSTRKIPNLPQPANALTDTAVFHNLPNGIVIDILASYESANGESVKTTLVSNYTVTAGTLPRTMTDPSLTGSVDASGNSTTTPFGSASGVVVNATDGTMKGFAASGNAVATTYGIPSSSMYYFIEAQIKLGTTGLTAGVYFFSGAHYYGLEWSASGSIDVVRYLAGLGGARVVLVNVGTVTQDTAVHYFRFSMQPGLITNLLAATFDAIVRPSFSDASIAFGSSFQVWIDVGDSTGTLVFFDVNGSQLNWLDLVGLAQIQGTITEFVDANGSYFQHGKIFADQIAFASGGATGQVSLDSVPDGATYARVLGTDLTTGHVSRSYTSPLNSPAYFDAAGNIAGFASGAIAAQNAYVIAAGRKLAVGFHFMMGVTTLDASFTIGTSVNGYAIKWAHTGGAVTLVANNASTPTTLATLVTVAMDATKWHWLALAVTPGATPGSSDIVEAWFDGTHYGPTTQGASVVTWGATTSINHVCGTGGRLANYRVMGQLV